MRTLLFVEILKQIKMAASTTLVIAISQVNRLFSKKLVNLTEYQICNISNYGNKNKNKKIYKKKYSKPYVSRNPTESKHTSQSNLTFEDDFEKGDEAKKTTKRKVRIPRFFHLKCPSSLSGFNTRLKIRILQGFSIAKKIKVLQ